MYVCMYRTQACAVELVGVVEALSVEDVYALYPSDERPHIRAAMAKYSGQTKEAAPVAAPHRP